MDRKNEVVGRKNEVVAISSKDLPWISGRVSLSTLDYCVVLIAFKYLRWS